MFPRYTLGADDLLSPQTAETMPPCMSTMGILFLNNYFELCTLCLLNSSVLFAYLNVYLFIFCGAGDKSRTSGMLDKCSIRDKSLGHDNGNFFFKT